MNYPFSGIIVRYLGKAVSSSESGDAARPTDTRGNADGVEVSEDQLHVNLWDLRGHHYLDVGLMVTAHQNLERIWIDVPWKLQKESVLDLGAKLDSEKMITAIFNELARYSGESEKEHADVVLELNNGERYPFTVAKLARPYFELDHHPHPNEGTRIKISLPVLPSGPGKHPVYLRIRLKDVPPKVFFSTFRQSDRNLLSSSSVTRLLDFRINVRRGVPDEILLGEPRLQFPKFKRIHLFAIVDREIELAFSSGNFKGSRSLEDESIWNDYLDLPKEVPRFRAPDTVRDYLGYQWTVSAKPGGKKNGETLLDPAKDLVALGRFAHTVSSRWNNWRFVAIVILLGASGSASWDIYKTILLTQGETAGSPSTAHMVYRLASLLAAVLLAMFFDRQTIYAGLGLIKCGVSRVCATIKSWWDRIESC